MKANNLTEGKIPGYRLNMTFDDTSMENVTIYISNDYVARILSGGTRPNNDEKELKNRIDEFYKVKNNKKNTNKEDFDSIFLDLVMVMVKKKNLTVLPNNNDVFKTSMSLKKSKLVRPKRFNNISNEFKNSSFSIRRILFSPIRKPKKPLKFKIEKHENINVTKSNKSVSLDEIYSIIKKTSIEKNKMSKNSTDTTTYANYIYNNKKNYTHIETSTNKLNYTIKVPTLKTIFSSIKC